MSHLISIRKTILKSNLLKILFAVMLLHIYSLSAFAQDNIYKTDNTVVEARVIKIGDRIEYKKFNFQKGPTYSIEKNKVSMIVYENGDKEYYNNTNTKTASAVTASANSEMLLPTAFSQVNARSLIVSEKIYEAIMLYANLVQNDSTNSLLRSEYAYSLALAGIYDAALRQLDILRTNGAGSAETNFFFAQVLLLINNTKLANQYWPESEKGKIPLWIDSKHQFLLDKYKLDNNANRLSAMEAAENFKQANHLAAMGSHFQSIGLFSEITNQFPEEYLPYVGYSIVLEQAGFYKESIKNTEKALTLIRNDKSQLQTTQQLEKRLVGLKQKAAIVKPKKLDNFNPSAMSFVGGMFASDLISLTAKQGWFLSKELTAMADASIMKIPSGMSTSVGGSLYTRRSVFVSGFGLNLLISDGTTTPNLKLSVGLSFLNKKKTFSYDIFIDGSQPLVKDGVNSISISVGRSFYFGKRKSSK